MIGIMRYVIEGEKHVADRKEEFEFMRSAIRRYGGSAFSFDLIEVPDEYA